MALLNLEVLIPVTPALRAGRPLRCLGEGALRTDVYECFWLCLRDGGCDTRHDELHLEVVGEVLLDMSKQKSYLPVVV